MGAWTDTYNTQQTMHGTQHTRTHTHIHKHTHIHTNALDGTNRSAAHINTH